MTHELWGFVAFFALTAAAISFGAAYTFARLGLKWGAAVFALPFGAALLLVIVAARLATGAPL